MPSSHAESKGMTEFYAVLVKLRLNLPMTDLSYRLDCSLCRYSSIFHKWINVMYDNLSQLVVWPDTETLKANLPISFQKHYSNVKCIIETVSKYLLSGQNPLQPEQQHTQIIKNITRPRSLLLYLPQDQ